jgi:hypothetical protein
MMLLGKKDPTERALIEDEIRGLKAELAQAQGRSGSVGGGGSGATSRLKFDALGNPIQ